METTRRMINWHPCHDAVLLSVLACQAHKLRKSPNLDTAEWPADQRQATSASASWGLFVLGRLDSETTAGIPWAVEERKNPPTRNQARLHAVSELSKQQADSSRQGSG